MNRGCRSGWLLVLLGLLTSCGSPLTGGPAGTGGTGAAGATGGTGRCSGPAAPNGQVDILFVIDDANEAEPQLKLTMQVPSLVQALEGAVTGVPDLHVAVISTDMGAPGNGHLSCTQAGDRGQFRASPGVACAGATSPIVTSDSFLIQSQTQKNFNGDLDSAIQCIVSLGANGCGFKQPLASIARALGADGSPAPVENAGFLRPEAALAIVVLTTEDDCSAPRDTPLFSLQTGQSSLEEPLGPLSVYRCNRYGHLCKNAAGDVVMPPLTPPADAAGDPPALQLTDCTSNDTGMGLLLPVGSLVSQIRALKKDPDRQIFVGAIVAPAAPYGVFWSKPPATDSSELWPSVFASCGVSGGDVVNPSAVDFSVDGSFGDPAVRITQFAQSFPQSVVTSICDPSYGAVGSLLAQAVASSAAAAPACMNLPAPL